MGIDAWIITALVLGLFILLASGLEIAFALGMIGMCVLIFALHLPIIEPMVSAWVITNSFSLERCSGIYIYGIHFLHDWD